MAQRVAIVTGGNRGIGLAIVRALCKQLGPNDVVYLTSRNEDFGKEAVKLLKKEGLSPRSHTLDVEDKSSIERFRDYIKATHGGLDILINNAGIMYKEEEEEETDVPKSAQAERTIQTNFFGVFNVTNILLPLVRSGGRVVHMSSKLAHFTQYNLDEKLKERFREASTEQEIVDLMNEFVGAVKAGDHKEKGWQDSIYGTSKLGVAVLTRIQAKEITEDESRQDILVNCCCPGYVATRLTAHYVNQMGEGASPDQGADTPVYLALLPPGTEGIQGQFVRFRKIEDIYEKDTPPTF